MQIYKMYNNKCSGFNFCCKATKVIFIPMLIFDQIRDKKKGCS